MFSFAALLIIAVVLAIPAILGGIVLAAGRFRGFAVVLAAVVGGTCLILIGLIGVAAISWFQVRSGVQSRVTGIAFGPPEGLAADATRSSDLQVPPSPPSAPSPPRSTAAGAPGAEASEEAARDGADQADPSPTRSPTPLHTAQAAPPPAWVDERAARVGGEYHLPIRVGPYTTPLECEQNLLAAVNQAVDEYVALYLGEQARGRVRLPRAFIEERLIRERWYENRPILVTSTEQAEMTVLHALLVFDSATNDYLKSLWRSVLSLYRVGVFAAGFAGVLWLLAVAWSYLKLDQTSAGRLRGCLRAAAVIAGGPPPLLLAFLLDFGGNWAATLAAGT